MRRPEGAFKAALQAYGYEQDVPSAINRMAQAQAETLILHELGEARADRLLGPAWQMLRLEMTDRRSELQLRALRDLLADCLVTLSTLLAKQDEASLHFWFANFEGMRTNYFPRLMQAYQAWVRGEGSVALAQAIQQGAKHWQQACQQVLALHGGQEVVPAGEIKRFLDAPQRVLS